MDIAFLITRTGLHLPCSGVSGARGLHRPASRLHSPMHSASAPRRAKKWVGPSGSKRPMQCSLCVKTKLPNMTATTNSTLEIHRLDDKRYALTLDGFVRYVGTQEECERRAVILGHKKSRVKIGHDDALAHQLDSP